MSLDDVLKLLFWVPVPLRRPTALMAVLLGLLATAVDLKEEYGLWEATQTAFWMSALCLSGILLLAWTVRTRSTLHVKLTLFWSALFLTIACFSAHRAYQEHEMEYNEIGFFQSREWTVTEKQPTDPKVRRFEWRVHAIRDLSQTPVFVELAHSPSCTFSQFWPTNDSKQYSPVITDVTIDSHASSKWRVQNLRKPADLRFILEVPIDSDPLAGCTPHITTGNSK